ncbi:hypothetical protein ACA910_014686 [Epithemia clementina (nom. ined.)]
MPKSHWGKSALLPRPKAQAWPKKLFRMFLNCISKLPQFPKPTILFLPFSNLQLSEFKSTMLSFKSFSAALLIGVATVNARDLSTDGGMMGGMEGMGVMEGMGGMGSMGGSTPSGMMGGSSGSMEGMKAMRSLTGDYDYDYDYDYSDGHDGGMMGSMGGSMASGMMGGSSGSMEGMMGMRSLTGDYDYDYDYSDGHDGGMMGSMASGMMGGMGGSMASGMMGARHI